MTGADRDGVSIRRIDDAIVAYRVACDGTEVGEIRPRQLGTAELHVPEGRYLLRRDDTADALAGGASLARALVTALRPNARWSLREDGRVLATASRRFRFGVRRDGVDFDLQDAAGPLTARMVDGLAGGFVLLRGDQRLARVASTRGGKHFAIAPGFAPDRVRCLFALYVLHTHFGTHPHPS